MNFIYHLTDEYCKTSILAEGLHPQLGRNSIQVGETEPLLYACDRDDLAYWMLILNKTIILQLPASYVKDTSKTQYNHYGEYRITTHVSPDKITPLSHVVTEIEMDNAKQVLQQAYLPVLSQSILRCTWYYTRAYMKELKEILYTELCTILSIVQRLDYQTMPRQVLRKELKDWGASGEYTFLDTYLNTNFRLYEQLLRYPTDELLDIRRQWHTFIQTAFWGCLDLNTGGWTG